MKQHLTAEEWGKFERNKPQAAQKLKDYYDAYKKKVDEENYEAMIEFDPIYFWFDISQMIEFLDKYYLGVDDLGANLNIEIFHDHDWFVRVRNKQIQQDTRRQLKRGFKEYIECELCDALWEAVKEVLLITSKVTGV